MVGLMVDKTVILIWWEACCKFSWFLQAILCASKHRVNLHTGSQNQKIENSYFYWLWNQYCLEYLQCFPFWCFQLSLGYLLASILIDAFFVKAYICGAFNDEKRNRYNQTRRSSKKTKSLSNRINRCVTLYKDRCVSACPFQNISSSDVRHCWREILQVSWLVFL